MRGSDYLGLLWIASWFGAIWTDFHWQLFFTGLMFLMIAIGCFESEKES